MRNPLSLEALIDWLEKQDPDQTFEYIVPNTCLMAQWLGSMGLPRRVIFGYSTNKGLQRVSPEELPDWLIETGEWDWTAGFESPFHEIAYTTKTFGAALDRARELLAEERAR